MLYSPDNDKSLSRISSRKSRNYLFLKARLSLHPLKAFTLLELLLVVAIIGITLGLSFPLMKKSVKGASFKSFSNKVYFFLDYAKTQSVFKNAVLKVRFDMENNKIILSKEEGEEKNIMNEIKIPEDFDLEFEEETIAFYPDGTIDAFNLVVHDQQDRVFEITSQGFDGKITTEK